jgi:hypothetical protein
MQRWQTRDSFAFTKHVYILSLAFVLSCKSNQIRQLCDAAIKPQTKGKLKDFMSAAKAGGGVDKSLCVCL